MMSILMMAMEIKETMGIMATTVRRAIRIIMESNMMATINKRISLLKSLRNRIKRKMISK